MSSAEAARGLKIGVIADDLTGATDVSLMLSRGGLRVLQCTGAPGGEAGLEEAEALVVALKTRTIPATEAVGQSLAALRFLLDRGADQILFKYCSTFDSTDEGNIGPVAEALMEAMGERRTIACPAMPANGRTVYMGHLFVGETLLSESSMKDHPLTPMRDANLVRVLGRQTARPVSLIAHPVVRQSGDLDRALAELDGIAIVDAIDEDDLLRIGRSARALRLITGGSGVAFGLAARYAAPGFRPRTEPLAPAPGRSVILAGSCSAATRRQIEVAQAAGAPSLRVAPELIGSGAMSVDDVVDFARSATGPLAPIIYSSADPAEVETAQRRFGRAEVGERIEGFLAEAARRLVDEGFTRLVVAGGETSGAVALAIGAEVLAIGPEIDPGVPWTSFRRGGLEIALALKSGNFGADDFFLKAWRLLA